MLIIIKVFLTLITIGAGLAFFRVESYWPSFFCLCLLIVIYKIDSLSELGMGKFNAKFHKLVKTLLLEKRCVEQLEPTIENNTAFVLLKKEPAINLIDVFWDNLYLQPETYKIDGRRITFDTTKEPGILQGGPITVTYYNRDDIEEFTK